MGLKAVSGSGGGSADVVGPSSSTDNAVARFDGTTGKLLQNSTVTISDTGVLVVPNGGSSATSIQFSGAANAGIYARTNGAITFTAGNINQIEIGHGGGSAIHMATWLGWTGTFGNSNDACFGRNAAGVLQVGTTTNNASGSLLLTNLTATGAVKLGSFTVATLPSAATYPGGLAYVTDASTTMALGLGGPITGGGANKTTAWSDGTNWNYG